MARGYKAARKYLASKLEGHGAARQLTLSPAGVEAA
jgi:hypothetical protein